MRKNWFTIKKVHPRVYALGEFMHWEKVVSYLFVGKTQAVLFDTGMGYGDIFLTVKSITNLPVKAFLTHTHWDHIGGGSQFRDLSIYDHKFEKNLLEKGFVSKKNKELTNIKLFIKPFKPKQYSVEGNNNYSVFKDKDIFKIDSWKVEVLHTPGHTPGSVSFLIPRLKLIFCGDTVYPGPLYLNLPESNFDDYCVSIKKISKRVDPSWKLFPGHNQTTSSVELIDRIKAACIQNTKEDGFQDGFSIVKKTGRLG